MIVWVSVVLRWTVVGSDDWRFDSLSGSHHQSQVKGCCQSNVLSPVCVHWLVSFAVMLLAVRLKWRRSVVIGQFGSASEVRLFCSVLTDWRLKTRPTEHTRVTRKGDVNNHIAEHHRLMNHTIDWDSAQCLTYSTNYFQRLTLESWFTNLEKTPLNRCQPLPAPYKRLIHDINITNKPNRTT